MLVMDEEVERQILFTVLPKKEERQKIKEQISARKKLKRTRIVLSDAEKIIRDLNKFNRKRYNKRRYL